MNSTDKRLADEFERVWPRVRPWAVLLFYIGCGVAGFASIVWVLR